MLKHGILGLLNYGDMSGYDILKVFKNSLNYFWNANKSQIYRELQNLEKKDYVSYIEDDTSIPKRKIYSITEKGIEELRLWLQYEDYGNRNSPLLMKTFFRGQLDHKDNIQIFLDLKKQALENIEKYKSIQTIISHYKNIGKHNNSLYWEMTVDYGKKYEEMLIEWCDDCLRKIGVYCEDISD